METLRKRLFYKATHRGMKETDRLLGGFAMQELANLSEELLHEFDILMDAPDADLLNWILGREDIPKDYDTEIMGLIIKFKESL
ncbi:MAG: succinate dehydrogenase assembly factor 2 [Rhodospirillaceae bacterium]|jgi:antitoxin CptB|nr:succinate dehydrogenase assembly factor 2 [Rhodospirillaceae bacterium]MBT7953644.1 succinate dehydrogenase assembly factor 2 [Rhodospirillaceae bacterium]